nr:hypothetical protein BaRGS_028699 [Batillaria attramentaria]
MNIIANEPSLAFFRIQEHVRKTLPQLVEQKHEVEDIQQQVQGACFDTEYAGNAVKMMQKSSVHFQNIQELLKNAMFMKQQIDYEDARSLNPALSSFIEQFSTGCLSPITESKIFSKTSPPSTTSSLSSFSSLKFKHLMAHGRERLLISFIVISVFGVVQLHFIMSHPRHRHGNPSPCPSAPGIHWVRDPTSCSKYFICVASQPVRMPACPPRTVWSEAAKNCVPANSLWNDCPKSQLEHMRPAPSPSPKPTPYSAEKARNWTASSDRMDALVDPLSPEKEQRERLLRTF